jgi:hypothetical protein
MTDPHRETVPETIDWTAAQQDLDREGFAILPRLLTPAASRDTAALYEQADGFRSRVVMQRHGYGRGEYRYFAYPLPPLVTSLRRRLYPPLAMLANRWQEALGLAARFPAAHGEFLARCRAAGQDKPTPLLLRYGPGDFNCLHQDLYGEQVFPLQVAILLSAPGADFTGGEFVLTEQRPRRQSRVVVVPLTQGDAVIFAVNQRPAPGVRGVQRLRLRHGVSPLRGGVRTTLGIIFHDAA